MIMRRLAAPLASLVLLLGLIFVGGISMTRPANLDDYFARVREVVEDIPLRIDGWTGRDEAITPAAQEALEAQQDVPAHLHRRLGARCDTCSSCIAATFATWTVITRPSATAIGIGI